MSIRENFGYLVITQSIEAPDIAIGTREIKTSTCCHCGTVVYLNPDRIRERGHCYRCNAYVCDHPACHLNCTPVMQSVELELDIVRTPIGDNGRLIYPAAAISKSPEPRKV